MAIWNKERHWRDRAEEARRIGEGMSDLNTRRIMFKIASEYEELASLAAEARADFVKQNAWQRSR